MRVPAYRGSCWAGSDLASGSARDGGVLGCAQGLGRAPVKGEAVAESVQGSGEHRPVVVEFPRGGYAPLGDLQGLDVQPGVQKAAAQVVAADGASEGAVVQGEQFGGEPPGHGRHPGVQLDVAASGEPLGDGGEQPEGDVVQDRERAEGGAPGGEREVRRGREDGVEVVGSDVRPALCGGGEERAGDLLGPLHGRVVGLVTGEGEGEEVLGEPVRVERFKNAAPAVTFGRVTVGVVVEDAVDEGVES
ncbi:hypothetical protein ABT072_10015 [Streptomyces sp. NPDC002589]|uniref:hypothetical protein n=1 Tax=Streptomyces sp. NPDC002589 TaxID=3154420 RepID=UPI003321B659